MDPHHRQSQLLLVSLLEQFCSVYEHTSDKKSQLFLEICKKLSFLGIIKFDDVLEEMSSVRSSYSRAFKELVVTALKDIHIERIESARKLTSPEFIRDNLPLVEGDETVKHMTSLLMNETKQVVLLLLFLYF